MQNERLAGVSQWSGNSTYRTVAPECGWRYQTAVAGSHRRAWRDGTRSLQRDRCGAISAFETVATSSCRLHYFRDTACQASPVLRFGSQAFASFRCDPVELGPAVRFRELPFAFEEAGEFQAMQ